MTPTKIEWTEETWNPVTGCTKVSAGCDHCYAERITERFHGKGSFEKIVLHPDRLDVPLHWRKPRTVFVNSMSDLFHADIPRDFIAEAFAVMALTSRHTYQVLTKRPGRMQLLLSDEAFLGAVKDAMSRTYERRGFAGIDVNVMSMSLDAKVSVGVGFDWPLDNVWLGVSVEDQEHADKRIPPLLETPASVRFLSCEPLLGPIGLGFDLDCLSWVIVGGESGPGARPMHPEWARSLRDQCVSADVPFFFKQWGEWSPPGHGPTDLRHLQPSRTRWLSPNGTSQPIGEGLKAPDDILIDRVGKKVAGRELDGRTWDEMPDRAGSLF